MQNGSGTELGKDVGYVFYNSNFAEEDLYSSGNFPDDWIPIK